MGRKKLHCDLPTLRRPTSLRGRELADTQLTDILRRVALTHRKAEAKSFYPLRDAAKQLGVPISAITRSYKQLTKEGLLSLIRGYRTVLQGRRMGRKLMIKSFIGLPVSYSCFMLLQDYRHFYLELRREAHSRRFVSNLIFYQDDSEGLEQLTKTLDEFGVDSVIWFLPRVSVRDTVLALQDRGISVVGVADGGSPGMACRYEIRREKALGAIFRRWRSVSGIRSIIIVRTNRRSPADEEMIEGAAEKAELTYDYRHLPEAGLAEAVTALGRNRGNGIVLAAAPAAFLSMRAPQAFASLLKSCRVALPDGAVTTVLGSPPETSVDLLTVNWHVVVKKIVGDLAGKRIFKEMLPTIFEARPHFDAPLHRYAENF
jgi:DNA-binding Lrp family transcriptional regulator